MCSLDMIRSPSSRSSITHQALWTNNSFLNFLSDSGQDFVPWVFGQGLAPLINISESSLTIYDLCHLSNELLPKYQQSTVDPRGSLIQLNKRMYPVRF